MGWGVMGLGVRRGVGIGCADAYTPLQTPHPIASDEHTHSTHSTSPLIHASHITWKMCRMRAPPASSDTGRSSLRPSSIALNLPSYSLIVFNSRPPRDAAVAPAGSPYPSSSLDLLQERHGVALSIHCRSM